MIFLLIRKTYKYCENDFGDLSKVLSYFNFMQSFALNISIENKQIVQTQVLNCIYLVSNGLTIQISIFYLRGNFLWNGRNLKYFKCFFLLTQLIFFKFFVCSGIDPVWFGDESRAISK
jgi:hypothetical protein